MNDVIAPSKALVFTAVGILLCVYCSTTHSLLYQTSCPTLLQIGSRYDLTTLEGLFRSLLPLAVSSQGRDLTLGEEISGVVIVHHWGWKTSAYCRHTVEVGATFRIRRSHVTADNPLVRCLLCRFIQLKEKTSTSWYAGLPALMEATGGNRHHVLLNECVN